MLDEAVLENFSDFQAWLVSYGIDIREDCPGANNDFNSGSAVVRFYWIEEVVNGVIFVLVRPALGETIVGLTDRETFMESTKLGRSFQGLHYNIVWFEEGKLAQLLDINRADAFG